LPAIINCEMEFLEYGSGIDFFAPDPLFTKKSDIKTYSIKYYTDRVCLIGYVHFLKITASPYKTTIHPPAIDHLENE
jgi:hypothetical protein